ncbi:reverse transcriptase domain-containing protein [Tanacetum coccineum]|uniref:Reverse transcriptase domain-containing protein n=1 Tax=Tanacetum coccineum TaxID=301880 RepID=A0ABQ5ES54_9ASTR
MYTMSDLDVADPTETVEEVAPTTLKGVNDRVTELAAVQEQDTQDIYAFHYEIARLLDQEALVSREAWSYSIGLSTTVHYELQAYMTHTQMQDYRIALQESLTVTLIAHVLALQGQLSVALGHIQALQARDQSYAGDREGAASMAVGYNNMPPKRTSATVRATAATAAATAMAAVPMTTAAVEQLIKGIEGVVVLAQWFERMESVFHISNCAVENQKTLKKMMTDKYCPRGEIKKLEIELWNLKVKGTDVMSYTLRFQELALMCGRMFHKESEEVEKYVGGLEIIGSR